MGAEALSRWEQIYEEILGETSPQSGLVQKAGATDISKGRERSFTMIPEWPNAGSVAGEFFTIVKYELQDEDMSNRDRREMSQAICDCETLEDARKVIETMPALSGLNKLFDQTEGIVENFPLILNMVRMKLGFYLSRGLGKYMALAEAENKIIQEFDAKVAEIEAAKNLRQSTEATEE